MKLSIIIVSYNVKEFLIQCLNSIQSAVKNIEHEIIIIDNDSIDGTSQIIPGRFPEYTFIANTENLGFARACNQGLKIARGEYILLLNPDTIVQEDTFEVLLEFMDQHPEAGMVGCKILNADGSLQLACRRSFPSPSVAIPKLLGLSFLFPKSRIFGRYNLTFLDENSIHEVDAISGSFMLVRKQVVDEVGFLDETFFMYGEDLDWCYRIKKAGWKIYYVPLTKIIHYKGESSRLSTIDNLITFYRAMDLFVKKHFSRSYSLFLTIILRLGILFRGLIGGIFRLIDKLAVPLIDAAGIILIMTLPLIASGNLSYQLDLNLIIIYLAIWLGSGFLVDLYKQRNLSYSRALVTSLAGLFFSLVLQFLPGFINTYHLPFPVIPFLIAFYLPGWRISFVLLQRWRIIPSGSFVSRAIFSRRLIIVGLDQEGIRVAERLNANISLGFHLLGFVDKEIPRKEWNGYRFLGQVSHLPEIVKLHKATEIIFTTERYRIDEIFKEIEHCKHLGVDFKIVPRRTDFVIGRASVERIEDISLMSVSYNLRRRRNRIMKRVFDLAVSLPVSLVLSILVLPMALLRGYRLRKVHFLSESGEKVKGYQFYHREKKTPGWLKKVPLWFSVVKGDLSIVGYPVQLVPDGKKDILCKPGIISLNNVSAKSYNGQIGENFIYYYLQNHSLFLDIEIALKSILRI